MNYEYTVLSENNYEVMQRELNSYEDMGGSLLMSYGTMTMLFWLL